ncbi:MAG TPA: RNA-guided endonuclease TnpB family protein, partial [Bacteroidota bacterium]|nr:RNA-guided endonuclease TnpB family protein [Bacteroidota bacterium]
MLLIVDNGLLSAWIHRHSKHHRGAKQELIRTFQYRAYCHHITEANALGWLELCRTLYNLGLEQRIMLWSQFRKSVSLYSQQMQLPELKQTFPEFAQVGSQVLQDALERLDRAFQAFFQRRKQGKSGFPRFKSKDRYDSFTLKQCGWKLVENKYLVIANVGKFKLKLSRPIEGRIKTVTVRRVRTGKWFISFSCDNVPLRQFPETQSVIGIDVGLKHFLVDSDGNVVENPKFLKQSMGTLARRQRSLSRKVKGSHRRQNAKRLVSKLHEKIANQRKDFLHKVSNRYIRSFKTIFIEDLNIDGMIRNGYLSRSIADTSWGMFFEMLRTKAEEAGREITKVKPNGTSQLCSACGEKVPKSLSVRV